MLRLSSRFLTGSFVTTAAIGAAYVATSSATRVSTATSTNKRAVCVLTPDQNSGVNGVVHFSQPSPSAPTTITATITGLSDGQHGFHVHQWGNLTKGCVTAGPHYNPYNKTHGGPQDEERHVGDLGNITSSNGKATYTLTDKHITLYGDYSIIGRSMVVHADQDDLGRGGYEDSKTTGHAGGRKYVQQYFCLPACTVHTPLITSIRIQSPQYTLTHTSLISQQHRAFSTHTGKSSKTPINTTSSPSSSAASVAAPSQPLPSKPIINGPRATITDDVNRPPPSHYTKTQTERAAVVHASPKKTAPSHRKRGKIPTTIDDDIDNDDDDEHIHRDSVSMDIDEDTNIRTEKGTKEERWKTRIKSTPQAQEQRAQRARERELDRQREKLRKGNKKDEPF